MLISEDEMPGIIPQKPPFVMVSALVACNEKQVSTLMLIRADNVLVENGFLSEAGLTENMAQTAAAGAGYRAKTQKKPAANGYIGAVNNLEIFKLPKVGDMLETIVIIEDAIFDITILKGQVNCDGVLLARCEMKIFAAVNN